MLYYILLLHFVSDFIFQHRWMARNKSHNQRALLAHVFTYGVVFAAGFYYMLPDSVPLTIFIIFMLFNVVAHYMTDAITSKMTSFLHDKSEYLFFVVIGFDQLIHGCTLIFSCRMFLEKIVGKEWLLG